MTSTIPKVFVSYSHDTLEHKHWVLELATRLRNNGIDAILDQFELQPGADIPHFMETHLSSSDKILMICTDKYVEKANKGEGGVGYEKMIITSNLLKRIDENKIIPIIRRKDGNQEVPTFLKSKMYIDISRDDDFEFHYDELVRTIHNRPLFAKPPVGDNPFTPVSQEKISSDTDLINNVLSVIAKLQGASANINSVKVANELKISFLLFKVIAIKLINLNYAEWYQYTGFNEHDYISITDKGILYAYENKLLN